MSDRDATSDIVNHNPTWRIRQTIFSSRWVRVPMELTAIPPVFFFLKKMSGGLRFSLARDTWWKWKVGMSDSALPQGPCST